MLFRDLEGHFSALYGARNRDVFTSWSSRIDYLNIIIGDVEDAIRRRASHEEIGTLLARVVARVFALAEHFGHINIAAAMQSKYPPVCIYCAQRPCLCPDDRPNEYAYRESHEDDRDDWSLIQWCAHLKTLYHQRNVERGAHYIIGRLFREVSEITMLKVLSEHGRLGPHDLKLKLAREVADVLAWTIALANFLDIPLADAVVQRYGAACWQCMNTPCQCTAISFIPKKWRSRPGE